MQLSLTGHHIDITPPLRSYVAVKMERIQRHFDNVLDAHCVLSVEKLRHRAEATVNFGGGRVFANSVADDMYAAIDSLIDKLDRRLKKYKEKLTDHHARDVRR